MYFVIYGKCRCESACTKTGYRLYCKSMSSVVCCMISRRKSRVFCELCSQKTPRGMLPVNSFFLTSIMAAGFQQQGFFRLQRLFSCAIDSVMIKNFHTGLWCTWWETDFLPVNTPDMERSVMQSTSFSAQVHFDHCLIPDVSEADGTEERRGCCHPCLPYRWLQGALPESHLPEEDILTCIPRVSQRLVAPLS